MPERASMPMAAATTRRQIREAERRTARRLGGRRSTAEVTAADPATSAPQPRTPRWLPRAAVLGALGLATIFAPLGGFGTADTAESAVVEEAPPVAVRQNALDTLDAAALRLRLDSKGEVAAVLAEGDAPARALVHSSRGVDRAVDTCTYADVSGANGARAAIMGESVVMPLAAGTYRQSSRYGNRVHPIADTYAMHTGMDLAAPLGTPVHAIADGVVTHAGAGIDGRSSMLVIVEHEIDGSLVQSWYVHMYPDGVFVHEGQRVQAGDVIAEVGNNGNSTGPHLHLEVHLGDEGVTTDPGAFLAGQEATPVGAGSKSC